MINSFSFSIFKVSILQKKKKTLKFFFLNTYNFKKKQVNNQIINNIPKLLILIKIS